MARPKKDVDINAIRQAVQDGKSIATIATENGVSQNTIRERISEAQGGIQYRNFRDMERNISGKKNG